MSLLQLINRKYYWDDDGLPNSEWGQGGVKEVQSRTEEEFQKFNEKIDIVKIHFYEHAYSF